MNPLRKRWRVRYLESSGREPDDYWTRRGAVTKRERYINAIVTVWANSALDTDTGREMLHAVKVERIG